MNGHSYPEVAARAIASVYQTNPSPVYGYLRSGAQQKIYLFHTLEDGRGWFTVLDQAQQPFDYAAVFSSTDLSRPVPGLESFGHTNVSGDPYVGNWLPFLLGLPLGGVAGYYLRRWQEPTAAREQVPTLRDAVRPLVEAPRTPAPAPTSPAPKTAGYPYVGGPWVDMIGPQVGGPWVDMIGPQVGGPWVDMIGPQVGGPWVDMIGPQVGGPWVDMIGPQVGGPWVDMIGPQVGATYGSQSPYEGARVAPRVRLAQARALIQSAIDDVTSQAASYPAEAYVWSLSAPGPSYTSNVMLTPQTFIVPFASRQDAMKYLREVAQTYPLASALFERSTGHWPNPVAWHKSDNPEHEPLLAQFIASRGGSTQTAGIIHGGRTTIGSAIDDVRRRAQTLAEKRAGSVIGVIHTPKDGLWHTLAFRSADDADDWLNTATQDQTAFTYAAYFDKDDATYPHPYIEKIGGYREPKSSQKFERRGIVGQDVVAELVGAALDDLRNRARQMATARPGAAAGVIKTAEGLWHALGFSSLDDAVDWLQAATREKTSFVYAAIFEKAHDGSAYFQDEEIGHGRAPAQAAETIRRGIATTSGHDYGWAA